MKKEPFIKLECKSYHAWRDADLSNQELTLINFLMMRVSLKDDTLDLIRIYDYATVNRITNIDELLDSLEEKDYLKIHID